MFDETDSYVFELAATVSVISGGAVERERDAFSRLMSEQHLLAAGLDESSQFDPSYFYAHDTIISLFPIHAHMAMSFYSALLHEATSERTFSDCNRHLSRLNRSLDPSLVCAAVIVNEGEKNHKMTPDEIKPFYKSKRSKAGE